MAKGSSTPRRSGSNASTSSSSHSAAVQGATRDIKQVLLSLRNSYRANTSVKVQVCLNLSNGTAWYAVPTPRRYARFYNTPQDLVLNVQVIDSYAFFCVALAALMVRPVLAPDGLHIMTEAHVRPSNKFATPMQHGSALRHAHVKRCQRCNDHARACQALTFADMQLTWASIC